MTGEHKPHSVPTDFEIVAEALDPWLRIEGRGEAIKALARIEEQLEAAQQFGHDMRALAKIEESGRLALQEQFEAMRVALDFFVNQPELVEVEDYLKARERFFNAGQPISSLDDRNPASSVGVPWNEGGYAGGSNPATQYDPGTDEHRAGRPSPPIQRGDTNPASRGDS